jgi:hypothetical protein
VCAITDAQERFSMPIQPTHRADCCPDEPVRTAMASDTPARGDVYTPTHDDVGGGLIEFLTSTQTLVLGGVAVLALVLLVAVSWTQRREDRDLERQSGPSGLEPCDGDN